MIIGNNQNNINVRDVHVFEMSYLLGFVNVCTRYKREENIYNLHALINLLH